MKNKKTLFYVIGGIVAVATVAIMLSGGGGGGSQNTVVSDECVELCQKANETCASLIDITTCQSKCPSFSEETKDHLNNATSCEELSQKPELIADVIIPEVKAPEQKVASNDCEAACGRYVTACLTLVPNATEALFEDGYNSCLGECTKWNLQKIDCMINAFDCESMTEVCGL